MFDHVTIRVSDYAASEAFYRSVLRTCGIEQAHTGPDFAEWDDFSLAAATAGAPVTRGLHIGFAAPSREHADEFWRAGTAAEYRDDGRPGHRPQYGDTYYGAFLLDPDGNSAEAVHHDALRRGGGVDHLWLRVADVAASKRFYETIGLHAGFSLRRDTPERAQFAGAGGSFSVVAGEPTEHVHVAFPAQDDETARDFHAQRRRSGTATTAGRASAPCTTPVTRPPTCSIPMDRSRKRFAQWQGRFRNERVAHRLASSASFRSG